MNCKHCGGQMTGDGVTEALMCENVDRSQFTREPDADPLCCKEALYENNICRACFYAAGCIDDGYSLHEGNCPIGLSLGEIARVDINE